MHMQSFDVESAIDLGSAWSRVAVFASAVDASLGRWLLSAYGVGLTEYRALTHLVEAPNKELRVNDLAQRVGLSQSSVTRLVSRLDSKKLTRRDICPDDGRGVYAVITELGEDLTREVRGPYEERVRELLGDVAANYPNLDGRQVNRALTDVSSFVDQQN